MSSRAPGGSQPYGRGAPPQQQSWQPPQQQQQQQSRQPPQQPGRDQYPQQQLQQYPPQQPPRPPPARRNGNSQDYAGESREVAVRGRAEAEVRKPLKGGDASEDEDEWSEGSDEEPQKWWQRRDIQYLLGGIALLAVVTGVLWNALNRPAPPPAPTTPAPTRAPVVAAMTVAAAPSTTGNPFAPKESMHDGNVCDNSEELFGGLCYMKCGLLTNGSYPIRTSSWTCCSNHPCGLSNQKGAVGSSILCNGFDIGGDGQCPHEPGACMLNEELEMDMCYKKCSILTDGRFPNRVGPSTCCAGEGMGCMNIMKDATSPDFYVGGNGPPHKPDVNLTEAGGVAAAATSPSAGAAPGFGGTLGTQQRCAEDEELYAGLCYRRCSMLTDGQYPIRTSSWTCCSNEPCGFSNTKGDAGSTLLCQGFGVGGSSALTVAGRTCPKPPKSCAPGEDEVLGVCYKSCNSLTNGQFPHRITAFTCCSQATLKACLSLEATSNSPNWAVATGNATRRLRG